MTPTNSGTYGIVPNGGAASLTSGYSLAPASVTSSYGAAPILDDVNRKPGSDAYDIVPGNSSIVGNGSSASVAASSYSRVSSTAASAATNAIVAGGGYSAAPPPPASMASEYSVAPPPLYADPAYVNLKQTAIDCAAPDLLVKPWYHGTVSREASEALLAGKESFAFLVRDSQQAPNTFTVSVVKFSGGIAHIMASPVEERGRVVGFKFGKQDPTVYRSIQHLIDVYTAMTGQMKTLGRAVPRAMPTGAAAGSSSPQVRR